MIVASIHATVAAAGSTDSTQVRSRMRLALWRLLRDPVGSALAA
jgi:hypothetical protein